MKTEVVKILEESRNGNCKSCNDCNIDYDITIAQATSSITTLIIKWLEEHKVKYPRYEGEARNQLITELIGEIK